MPTVKKIRQGDSFTHVWHNHSLLRKPITNVMMQQNYYIQGSMVAEPSLLTSSVRGGVSIAWDAGLDVSTAPKYGTIAKEAETNLGQGKPRKRMRNERQEDLALTEVADIAFDHQRSRKTNNTKLGFEQISGSFTVSNRTLINKVLYTNEDTPEMVLIHVPPILRPNSSTEIL